MTRIKMLGILTGAGLLLGGGVALAQDFGDDMDFLGAAPSTSEVFPAEPGSDEINDLKGLETLQRKIAMKQLEVRYAELEVQKREQDLRMSEIRREIEGGGDAMEMIDTSPPIITPANIFPPLGGQYSPLPMPTIQLEEPDTLKITLVAIRGVGKTLKATIVTPGGAQIAVIAGDRLPDGSEIVTVTPSFIRVDMDGDLGTLDDMQTLFLSRNAQKSDSNVNVKTSGNFNFQ